MSGRHRRPPLFPRWLAGAGLSAAVLMVGSLAFLTPPVPVVGMSAALAVPTYAPDPVVEPLMTPPPPVVSTPVTTTPGRRVRAETAQGVDTTSKLRRSTTTTTTRQTTGRPSRSTTTTTTKSTPGPTPKPSTSTSTSTGTGTGTSTGTSTTKAKPVAACSTSLAGTRPHVAAAGYRIKAATGFSGTILGRAGRAGGGEHPKGLALDFMTSDGGAILAYVRAHFGELNATYAIYRQTYYPARGGSRKMADRGGPTANHYDHVHVSFAPGGGASC